MAKKVWIEVALNGSLPRSLQPNIPVSAEEVIEDGINCVKAGAAILHLHARDPDTGLQNDNPDVYQTILEGIRAETDAVVYPTMPVHLYAGWTDRYQSAAELGRRGLLEWAVVDPGSLNLNGYDFNTKKLRGKGILYTNTDAEIRRGMMLSEQYQFHAEYACFEPGFIRLGAAMHKAYPAAPMPIYSFRFAQDLTFGLPPEEWALDAMLKLLALEAPGAPWMAACMGGNMTKLVKAAVARGGHVRTGLEDAPVHSKATNVSLVQACVDTIQGVGAEPATGTDVRAALAEYG
ncbi:MAG: 3-keto-5-aminohexanoate cleavage protein [Pseudomonadales bacterium]|nr:3-keto-5-aminohexanoate cleavage protein [Pseudomonadales bacterium]